MPCRLKGLTGLDNLHSPARLHRLTRLLRLTPLAKLTRPARLHRLTRLLPRPTALESVPSTAMEPSGGRSRFPRSTANPPQTPPPALTARTARQLPQAVQAAPAAQAVLALESA